MVDSGRIRVVMLLHTAFDRAALPPLVEADARLNAIDRSGQEPGEVVARAGERPDVVVVGTGPSVHHDCAMVHLFAGHLGVPVIVVAPSGATPEARVAYLEAGAAAALVFDVVPDSVRLLAFQSLLLSRIKAFHAAGSLVDQRRQTLDQVGRAPHRGSCAGKGGDVAPEGELGSLPERLEVRRRFGQPRSPLEPAGGWHLVQPRRKWGVVARDLERRAEVVVFGVGQGGVAAFSTIVRRLPAEPRMAGLAVVRLPGELLHTLARRLDQASAIRVRVAREGDPVAPGFLLLAPADKNLGLVRTGRIPRALCRIVDPEPDSPAVPRIDTTLRATARIYGSGSAGVVLAGLDGDGVDGLEVNRAMGGINLVLDPRDAIVGRTNLRCIDAGLADRIAPLDELAAHVAALGSPVDVVLAGGSRVRRE